jgi:hypothetical protein
MKSKTISYAQATAGTNVPPDIPGQDPFVNSREGLLALEMPPGKTVSKEEIALAIHKQCKEESLWQPLVINGKIYLQALAVGELTNGDKANLIENGLAVGGLTVKVKAVYNTLNNIHMLSGRITGFTATEYAFTQLKGIFEKLGPVCQFEQEYYPGTKVPTGTIYYIIDITDNKRGPKLRYRIEDPDTKNIDYAEVIVHGKRKFCFYCRSSDHVRKDCESAPRCSCGSRAHPPERCDAPTVPSPVSPPVPEDGEVEQTLPNTPGTPTPEGVPGTSEHETVSKTVPEAQTRPQAKIAEVVAKDDTALFRRGAEMWTGKRKSKEVSPPVEDDEATQHSTPPSDLLDTQSQFTEAPEGALIIVEDAQGLPGLRRSSPSPSTSTSPRKASTDAAPPITPSHQRHASVADGEWETQQCRRSKRTKPTAAMPDAAHAQPIKATRSSSFSQ